MNRFFLQPSLSFILVLTCANIGQAAECSNDPSECTLKELCETATSLNGESTVWSSTAIHQKHVALAQQLSMNCGITVVFDPCYANPAECKVSQICERATTYQAGALGWNNSAEGYVAIAKDYGLSCGVRELKVHQPYHSLGNFDYLNRLPQIKTFEKHDFRDSFASLSRLYRQQIQYALKKLGYYSKGIDGVWGKGTESAVLRYAQRRGLQGVKPRNVYRNVVAEVDVPASFASPKRRAVRYSNSLSADEDVGLLKVLLLARLCSVTSDPSACMAGAAGIE